MVTVDIKWLDASLHVFVEGETVCKFCRHGFADYILPGFDMVDQ